MTLILLFVMTLLGVASLRMTTMDEQMVGNNRLREIAFNAAETTLTFAEQELLSNAVDLRAKVFTNGQTPVGNAEPGDSCTAGYCTPSQYHFSTTLPENGERWLDSTLNVWETTSKHHVYEGYVASGLSNQGVFSAPKYIVEFLGGSYEQDPTPGATRGRGITTAQDSKCFDYATNQIEPAAARTWPFCADDPQVARITALAVAGDPEKNARVMLQSTIVYTN